jgi:hypothetical protein
MNLNIKFSQQFVKLPVGFNGTFAKLVKVEGKKFSDLDSAFVEEDSRYVVDGEVKHYIFDFRYDRCIVLTFVHESGVEFTTIRSYTADKFEYYLKNVGLMFELVRSYE